MTNQRLTLRTGEKAVVRMYGQGFGDCFLLAFPRRGKGGLKQPVYVVIDCGVFSMTPGGPTRMRAVTADVLEATGGKVDLLVVTHEHYDHVSGFEQARDVWKQIEVGRIWLAWTEDPADETAISINRERVALRTQAIAELVGAVGPAAATGMLGVDELEAPDRFSPLTDAILDDLATAPERRFKASASKTIVDFLSPGEVRAVPAAGIDAYVLAPPRSAERLAYCPSVSETRWPVSGEDLSWAGAVQPSVTSDTRPFAAGVTLNAAGVPKDRFFREHYYEADPDRWIETDWLQGYNRLALQFERVTNNTSLVLAFRLADGQVLLFPGDAEAGSWLSWFDLKPEDWRRKDGRKVRFRPEVRDLLRAVALYKVSHHGSATGTPVDPGIDALGSNLVALVPCSVHYPQDNRRWRIPFPPLMDRLRKATGKRVVHPQPELDGGNLRPSFLSHVKDAPDSLGPMMSDNQIVEGPVPCWREIRMG